MNTMHSFFCRACHSLISHRAAVLLVALALSSLVPSCGRNDAARDGDLGDFMALLDGNADSGKFKALLKDNPNLVSSRYTNGWTPLHFAAHRPSKAVVELLLANEAEVNAKDNNGGTPLLYATAGGRRDVAQVLLANKAEVNAKANDGQTPLHWAAANGHKDVVELLLANKAEVNAKANNGYTPLQAARGHEAVAALLRQHGGHE